MPSQPAGHSGPSRARRLLPGLWVLRHYQRTWLRGDVVAGVTVAAYLVPQVMAYAEVAGLPAITGLWAVVAPLAVYAILGSSRQLSVGPESTTALMTAAAVGALVAGNPDRYAETAAALAIAVGCCASWAGSAGWGSWPICLSRPVLIGYMAGIAVLMIISQLGKVTRIDVEGGSTFAELRFVCHASSARPTYPPWRSRPACCSCCSPSVGWFPRLPGPLIAMLLAAGIVVVFNLDQARRRRGRRDPPRAPVPGRADFQRHRAGQAHPGRGRGGDRRLLRQCAHRPGRSRPSGTSRSTAARSSWRWGWPTSRRACSTASR